MPNVYTDINDFMPYARSMAKRVIREGKRDGVQQFTNDLVALSNEIYDLAQDMPAAWEQYRKITNERERQSREIAEKQKYIEELNKNLAEQFGTEGGTDDNDADIMSMLSDSDDMFDFGDDDAAPSDMDARQADDGSARPQQRQAQADDSDAGTQDDGDNDDDLFAVFGGDYGSDGDGRASAESDSWGNADERAGQADDGIMYDTADDDDGQSTQQDADDDDSQPDIDWSTAAGQDEERQAQPQPSPQAQPAQQPSSSAQRQQDAGSDPFDDDDIDVLLDDDTLLGL